MISGIDIVKNEILQNTVVPGNEDHISMKTLLRIFYLLSVLPSISCQRGISWEMKATGTLKDAGGICFPVMVYGTYYNGISPADSNYLEVTVNVFSPGVYNIFTNTENGLSFSDSGVFSSSGLHVLKLKPTGMPVSVMPVDFALSFDTSACSIALDIHDSAALHDDIPLNTWRFTDINDQRTYSGIINATHFLITPLSTLLSVRQEANNPGDTTFEIGLVFPTGVITPGIFKTDSLNNMAFSTQGRCINCAWDVMYKLTGALTTIYVDSYDPVTDVIRGRFSGTTTNWDNEIAPIKDGRFAAVVKK